MKGKYLLEKLTYEQWVVIDDKDGYVKIINSNERTLILRKYMINELFIEL